MLCGNNQIKFVLTPDRFGVVKHVSGHELISSLEIHKDITLGENTGYSFTLTTDSSNVSLPTTSLPTVPMYIDGSSKVSGLLDGGLIVAGNATIGNDTLDLNVIGGNNANVMPVLSIGYNEILSPDNDIVYAILSTDQAEGEHPITDHVQLTFATVTDTGTYIPYTLTSDVYYIEPNTIYSFGHARLSNLASNGQNTSLAGSTSLDELKGLISTVTPLTWITPTLVTGWENYGHGFATARYAIKDNVVYMEGVIKNGPVGAPIFILPPEGRPSNVKVVPVPSGIGTGRLQVYPNGYVVLVDGDPSFTSIHATIFK